MTDTATLQFVVCPIPALYKEPVDAWKNDHEGYYMHTDVEFVDNVTAGVGLFGRTESHYVLCDTIVKKDFDTLYRCVERGVDILLVTAKKTRFGLKKYPLVHLTECGTTPREVDKYMAHLNLSRDGVRHVKNRTDSSLSKVVAAWQIMLVDDYDSTLDKYVTNPCLSPDNAPWDLFNAILHGNRAGVIESLRVLLFNNGNDAMGIIFPMVGYMRKVLLGALPHDEETMTAKQYAVFSRQAKNIRHVDAFVRDLDFLVTHMFQVNKNAAIDMLYATALSLSCRCGTGATDKEYA